MNRIWIELENDHSDPKVCKERAEKASILLKRLGVNFGDGPVIFYNEDKKMYCLITSVARTFTWQQDNGSWFDLDELASLAEQQSKKEQA